MKKAIRILSAALCIALAFSFAACSAANKDEMGNSLYPSHDGSPDFGYSSGGDLFYNGGSGIQADVIAPSDPDAAPDVDQDAPDADGDDAEMGEPTGPVFAENPFVNTSENGVSTFSADVDTASYTYFRRLVTEGYALSNLLHSGSAFRTEEFINYFTYGTKAPDSGELFGVSANMSRCPWSSESYLLRLSLRAEDRVESAGNNLVFLIDVSGSMASKDKLELIKTSFSNLVGSLTERDRVSIVTYSGREQVVLEGCPGNRGEMIMNAINSLTASGSTNGEAGLTRAYALAEANFIAGGNNRIIMASDGDLNVGISSSSELAEYISQKRDQGIYISVLGFGIGNYRDANMEAIANNGNGVYYYIDGASEAERVFGTALLSTLYTVAEDVKLQIEFNPDTVEAYRLIGYENRLLAPEDFDDDTKDAAEVGAAQTVTVCYELKLYDAESASGTFPELFSLRFRYKEPGSPLSLLDEHSFDSSLVGLSADEDMKFIECVIETCMLLHNSEYLNGDITLDSILAKLKTLDLDPYPDREEFSELIGALCDRD